MGNRTRVLSEWVGDGNTGSIKTKEGHGLGRCQPTPPFVYSLIKGQVLLEKLKKFKKRFNEVNRENKAAGRGGGKT